MLNIYAQCLKHLNRIEEYIRVALKGLARMSQGRSMDEELAKARFSGRPTLRRPFDCSSLSLSAIIFASTSLEFQVLAQMNEFFEGMNLGTHIRHLSDQDGFVLPLTLHSLLPEAFQAQSVRVRIVCHEEDQRSELWLAAEGTQTIEPGIARLALKSSVSKHVFAYKTLWLTKSTTENAARLVCLERDTNPSIEHQLLTRSFSLRQCSPVRKK